MKLQKPGIEPAVGLDAAAVVPADPNGIHT